MRKYTITASKMKELADVVNQEKELAQAAIRSILIDINEAANAGEYSITKRISSTAVVKELTEEYGYELICSADICLYTISWSNAKPVEA